MSDTVAITCCHEACGLTFHVPRGWYDQRKSNGKSFCCPNGHGQHFTGEVDKLRSEVERLKAAVESRDRTIASVRDSRDIYERRLNAQKGATTKLRKKLYPEESA